ncbi:MAG: Ycf66 family protein [Geitlerinemataceae cyanobacterium]
MVNVGLGWSSFVGICLVVAGVALYALRSLRPNLARDHDIFFSAVALVCGGILFFNGWRQDPILQFGQFLLTGSAIFFAYDSIRLRGIVTQQAKRTAPVVDEDRPVSSSYRTYEDSYEAELEEIEPVEYPPNRRIPGSRESRRPTRDPYEDESRRPPSRRPSSAQPNLGKSSAQRRPRPIDDRNSVNSRYDDWDSNLTADSGSSEGGDLYGSDRSTSSSRSRSTNGRAQKPPRQKRPYPSDSPAPRSKDDRPSIDATPVDYFDYRPPQSSSSGNDVDEAVTGSRAGDSRPSRPSKRRPKSDFPKSDFANSDVPKSDFDVKAPPIDYDADRSPSYPTDEDNRSDFDY